MMICNRPLKRLVTAIFATFILHLLIAACGQSPSTSLSIPSPDGSLLLKSSVNHSIEDPARYLCVIVEVKNLYGKTLYREITPASDTMRWSIQWISNDAILLDSSDIGRYIIRRVGDKLWMGGFENPNPQV
ncbi:MAG: hypothetical protein JSV83_10705 [Desulfobacterales bacterium]|nr:MAG: hypothetical protein JSV83_10705 [Desulfobacterales bacterium]